MQTEGLLEQSQQLATELQRNRENSTNQRATRLKAQQLAEQNAEVERKNQESSKRVARLRRKPKSLL